jgi:hypothetical protein
MESNYVQFEAASFHAASRDFAMLISPQLSSLV